MTQVHAYSILLGNSRSDSTKLADEIPRIHKRRENSFHIYIRIEDLANEFRHL